MPKPCETILPSPPYTALLAATSAAIGTAIATPAVLPVAVAGGSVLAGIAIGTMVKCCVTKCCNPP